jgi:hypothetical protein
MDRARRIRDRGIAAGHAQAVALLEKPGDLCLDFRGAERAIVMLCPDGCGDVLTINLDRRSGKAWRRDTRREKLTVYPSVWRDTGCGAHFIIWRDEILWCDWREGPEPGDNDLVKRVRQLLLQGGGRFLHYETVAEGLGENPWDAHWACAQLVRQGEADVADRVLYRLRTA